MNRDLRELLARLSVVGVLALLGAAVLFITGDLP